LAILGSPAEHLFANIVRKIQVNKGDYILLDFDIEYISSRNDW